MCVRGGEREMAGGIAGIYHQASFSFFFFFNYQSEVLTLSWSLLDGWAWLASELQEPACLNLPSTQTISVHHHAWLFLFEFWGPNACTAKTLLIEPSPQPCSPLVLIALNNVCLFVTSVRRNRRQSMTRRQGLGTCGTAGDMEVELGQKGRPGDLLLLCRRQSQIIVFENRFDQIRWAVKPKQWLHFF